MSILRAAISAVPVTRYALGIAGVVIAATIAFRAIREWPTQVTLRDAIVVLVMLMLMLMLMAIAQLAKRDNGAALHLPAQVLAWMIIVIFPGLLLLSVFAGLPLDLRFVFLGGGVPRPSLPHGLSAVSTQGPDAKVPPSSTLPALAPQPDRAQAKASTAQKLQLDNANRQKSGAGSGSGTETVTQLSPRAVRAALWKEQRDKQDAVYQPEEKKKER